MSASFNTEFISKALGAVAAYIQTHLEKTDPDYEIYIVWFVKTLQNWKALVSTSLNDGMYYEVTYNGDKMETYIDAYKKFNNVRIEDDIDVDIDSYLFMQDPPRWSNEQVSDFLNDYLKFKKD